MDKIVTELYNYAIKLATRFASGRLEKDDLLQEILLVFLEVSKVKKDLPECELVKYCKISAKNRVIDLLKRADLVKSYQVDIDYAKNIGFSEDRLIFLRLVVGFIAKRLTSRQASIITELKSGKSALEIINSLPISRATYYREKDNIKTLLAIEL